jgi:hypothetical protein
MSTNTKPADSRAQRLFLLSLRSGLCVACSFSLSACWVFAQGAARTINAVNPSSVAASGVGQGLEKMGRTVTGRESRGGARLVNGEVVYDDEPAQAPARNAAQDAAQRGSQTASRDATTSAVKDATKTSVKSTTKIKPPKPPPPATVTPVTPPHPHTEF